MVPQKGKPMNVMNVNDRIAMTINPNKMSCGCDFESMPCGCKLEPFTVTRSDLRRLSKGDLFTLYTRCINDEVSPVMWRGFTKPDILEMFLDGGDSVELTPST